MGGIEGGERSAGHSHQSLSPSSSQGDSGGMQLEGTAGFIGLNLILMQAQHIVCDRLFTHTWTHTCVNALSHALSLLLLVLKT